LAVSFKLGFFILGVFFLGVSTPFFLPNYDSWLINTDVVENFLDFCENFEIDILSEKSSCVMIKGTSSLFISTPTMKRLQCSII
jgi:hypothetical protein